MLRIAHISDLHIRHPQMNNDDLSLVQRLAKMLGSTAGVDVHAGGHDDNKLIALQNILIALEPDVIVVTGDLTNFGDKKSFELAYTYLQTLKKETGARSIFCVPGNHDCLCERAAELKTTRLGRWGIWFLSKINREVELMGKPDTAFLSKSAFGLLDAGQGLALFDNYKNSIVEKGFGAVDPGTPVLLDADWGKVALFLFNSVNDAGVMANEGRIGAAQFNVLNGCLQDPDKSASCTNAVRIALLHHHPISAPQSLDAGVNRLYDWMKDGPLMLRHLSTHEFHFILHGHQHEPFECTINYGPNSGSGLHIVAAGSATQGTSPPHRNSFNLIDLLTPFEARLRRFEYAVTGFDNLQPAVDVMLPVRPLEQIRVTTDDVPSVEDWAMRQLVRGCYEDAYDIDSKHQYDLLEYLVYVDRNQTYRAAYRRVGKVVGSKESDGLHFVITGSPAMETERMNISAFDGLDASALSTRVVLDRSHQKVVQVLSRMPMAPGSEFDITLKFAWQATESEPNHFDGINLMTFRHPVKLLRYHAKVPWQPAQAKVLAYGVKDSTPVLQNRSLVPSQESGWYEYSFEIADPETVAYLISFRPN